MCVPNKFRTPHPKHVVSQTGLSLEGSLIDTSANHLLLQGVSSEFSLCEKICLGYQVLADEENNPVESTAPCLFGATGDPVPVPPPQQKLVEPPQPPPSPVLQTAGKYVVTQRRIST